MGQTRLGSNRTRPEATTTVLATRAAATTTTYPFEIWFYRHLEGVGDGLEIEFVDPTGTGEYRLARDANEKDALEDQFRRGTTTSRTARVVNQGDRGNDVASGLPARAGLYVPPDGDTERFIAAASRSNSATCRIWRAVTILVCFSTRIRSSSIFVSISSASRTTVLSQRSRSRRTIRN